MLSTVKRKRKIAMNLKLMNFRHRYQPDHYSMQHHMITEKAHSRREEGHEVRSETKCSMVSRLKCLNNKHIASMEVAVLCSEVIACQKKCCFKKKLSQSLSLCQGNGSCG